VIATNHGFWTEKKESIQNLRFLLGLVRDGAEKRGAKQQHDLDVYVSKIKRRTESISGKSVQHSQILDSLCKTELEDDLPKLDDWDLRLSQHIPIYYPNTDANLSDLCKTARHLINMALEAGSRADTPLIRDYFAFCKNPDEERNRAIIEAKRITRSKVEAILAGVISHPSLLHTRKSISIGDLPLGLNIMDQKMTRGDVAYRNVELMKDQKYSAELLLTKWLHKYGAPKANDQFDHLRALIVSECMEVYDESFRDDQPFGQEMLIELRKRLRTRRDSEKQLFFDCEYEHLLGIVGILTDLCDVWWSKHFDIQHQGQA
jgi:hypothetical protein